MAHNLEERRKYVPKYQAFLYYILRKTQVRKNSGFQENSGIFPKNSAIFLEKLRISEMKEQALLNKIFKNSDKTGGNSDKK